MGVVKADAYGHGSIPVAAVLRESGCQYLAVACPEEAFALRQAGETLPILILGAVDAAFAPRLAEQGIAQAVECLEKGKALSAALAPGQKLKIHIKLDTGMGRLGFTVREETALAEAAAVTALPGLETEGVSPISPYRTPPEARTIPGNSSPFSPPQRTSWSAGAGRGSLCATAPTPGRCCPSGRRALR